MLVKIASAAPRARASRSAATLTAYARVLTPPRSQGASANARRPAAAQRDRPDRRRGLVGSGRARRAAVGEGDQRGGSAVAPLPTPGQDELEGGLSWDRPPGEGGIDQRRPLRVRRAGDREGPGRAREPGEVVGQVDDPGGAHRVGGHPGGVETPVPAGQAEVVGRHGRGVGIQHPAAEDGDQVAGRGRHRPSMPSGRSALRSGTVRARVHECARPRIRHLPVVTEHPVQVASPEVLPDIEGQRTGRQRGAPMSSLRLSNSRQTRLLDQVYEDDGTGEDEQQRDQGSGPAAEMVGQAPEAQQRRDRRQEVGNRRVGDVRGAQPVVDAVGVEERDRGGRGGEGDHQRARGGPEGHGPPVVPELAHGSYRMPLRTPAGPGRGGRARASA